MKKATAEWVRKAEADHDTARTMSRKRPPRHDVVCFHCQQCAEKYLKALLEELGLPVPRTHELDSILGRLLPHHATLRSVRRGMDFLTQFAVDTRYPGENATRRKAEAALRWEGRVRTAARALLGIRPPRSCRKKSK
jgi:HEPN domain-containing protein